MLQTGRRGVGIAVAGAVALTPLVSSPALADRPGRAGPQVVTVLPLAGDPISFVCGERVLSFTGGQLVERVRELSAEEGRGTRRAVDAVLQDQFGSEYAFVGHSTFRFVDGRGSFHVTGVLRGSHGTETVNSRLVLAGEGMPELSQHGTCGIQEE